MSRLNEACEWDALVARFLNSMAIADEAFAPKSRSEEKSMC
jgi:hypothetical protein